MRAVSPGVSGVAAVRSADPEEPRLKPPVCAVRAGWLAPQPAAISADEQRTLRAMKRNRGLTGR